MKSALLGNAGDRKPEERMNRRGASVPKSKARKRQVGVVRRNEEDRFLRRIVALATRDYSELRDAGWYAHLERVHAELSRSDFYQVASRYMALAYAIALEVDPEGRRQLLNAMTGRKAREADPRA